jgi:hypothetical protein
VNDDFHEPVRQFADEHVIGDRCPCDKCGSNVKHRLLAVFMAPVLATTVVGTVLTEFGILSQFAATGGMGVSFVLSWFLLARPMIEVVNEQMPEICPNTGMQVKL